MKIYEVFEAFRTGGVSLLVEKKQNHDRLIVLLRTMYHSDLEDNWLIWKKLLEEFPEIRG